MSEIALITARKSKLELSAKKGSKNAQTALKIVNSPNNFFSTIQIGITLIGILTGVFSSEEITQDVQKIIENTLHLNRYTHAVSLGIVAIIITFVSLIFGELLPKRIGLSNPETIAKVMARPMNVITQITRPLVWILTHSTDMLIQLLGIRTPDKNTITEEEIKAIIREGTATGEVQEIEQNIVERVFNLGDRTVSSIMTHKNKMCFLEVKDNMEEIKNTVNTHSHSVYPVYDQNRDDIKGVVFLKDLFVNINQDSFEMAKILKTAQFFIENTSVYDALKQFKETDIHYGIIIDEFGQTQGIITMHDVLEGLVGGVYKFNKNGFKIEQRLDGSWLIDGYYPFHEFLHYFDLDEFSNQYRYNTLSGLIFDTLKHLPVPGEKLCWHNLEIEIVDMDGVKIDKVIVKLMEAELSINE